MSENSKSKLRRLQIQWSKKLKASGFKDAERFDGRLKDHHAKSFSKILPDELEERRRYFTLAEELGKGYVDDWGNKIDVFAGCELDRKTWLLYCEGLTQQEIAAKCHLSCRTVNRVIAKYNKYIIR